MTDAASDWQVYILKCSDGSLYTGITNDIQQRLSTHNNGKASKYTRSRLPVELLYSEPSENRATASRREAEIKRLPRIKKLHLLTSG